ncbi:MAG: hypothetical protein HY551_07055 [Elusimicrobia bacterium]|nr:hypothetical protein [Elusimicrobiota bacterium]
MPKIRILGATLWLLPAFAFAIDDGAGTGGAAFMKMGLGSTRAMGMGRALVALAEGTDALTWNPAGLALAQTREMNYSYLRYVQEVEAPLYMAYAHPLGRTVLGANLAYLSVDGFDVRDSQGRVLDNSNVFVRDGFATMSAARSFYYEKIFLGLGLKGVYEDNAGSHRQSLVADFGLMVKPTQGTSLGLAFQNLGGSQSRVAKITRLGGAVRLFELLNLSLELSRPSDSGWQAGIGGEFTLPEEYLSVGQVTLRTGYFTTGNQGSILKADRSALYPLIGAQGISFGIGLFTSQAFGYGLGVDYALVPMGALGTADHLSVRLKF